jgi:hypothetical protein
LSCLKRTFKRLGRFFWQKKYFCCLWNGLTFIVSDVQFGNFNLKNRPLVFVDRCYDFKKYFRQKFKVFCSNYVLPVDA